MRLIKLGGKWYNIKDLIIFIELLKTQETTDKDEPGEYVLSDNNYEVHYRIDLYNDIIIDKVVYYWDEEN